MSLNAPGQPRDSESAISRTNLASVSRLPWSCAPNRIVGTVGGGIEVVLLSVEIWQSRVVLQLGAYPDARTAALTACGDVQLAEWKKAPTKSPPPQDPSIVLIQSMHIEAQRDLGDRYELAYCKAGGEDEQWASTWVFRGAHDGGAIVIVFTSESGTAQLSFAPD